MRRLPLILIAAGGAAAAAALPAGGTGAVACPLVAGSPPSTSICQAPPTAASTDPIPLPGPAGLPTHPRARPARGRRNTVFRIYGTVRVALGVHGSLQRELRISAGAGGPAHAGCGSAAAEQVLAQGAPGTVFRVSLPPPTGGWCRGSYRGTIVLDGGPYCPPPAAGGPPVPCPEFALAPQLVGRFSFHVR